MYAVGYNNSDNVLALDIDDFEPNSEVSMPKKVRHLSEKKIKKFTATEKFGVALTEKGRLLFWGRDMKKVREESENGADHSLPHEPNRGKLYVDFACGRYFIAMITRGNELVVWGYLNDDRRMYNFETIRINSKAALVEVACGWYHLAVRLEDGEVLSCGRGDAAQLGYCWSPSKGYTKPERISLPDGYGSCKKIDCGAFSTVVLAEDGSVYVTGEDKVDLPCSIYGSIETVRIDMSSPAISIAASSALQSGKIESRYACQIDSGSVYRFGRKSIKGEVVQGLKNMKDVFANFRTPQSLSVRQVAEGDEDPATSNLHHPETEHLPADSILRKWPVFNNLGEDLAEEIKLFTVFGGYDGGEIKHLLGAFVVTNDDSVYGIGLSGVHKYLGVSGESSELYFHREPVRIENLGGKNLRKILVNHSQGTALSRDGSVYFWDEVNEPKKVQFIEDVPVLDVASGARFFLYLLEDSRVFFHGDISSDYAPKKFAEIPIPGRPKIESIASGEWHCAVLTDDHDVFTFGHGIYCQLGYKWKDTDSPFTPRKVELPGKCKKVICGVSSTIFLAESGELWACGFNRFADVLGVGHGNSVISPERIPNIEPVVDVEVAVKNDNFGARVSVFIAVTKSGKILRWGGEVEVPTEVEGISKIIDAFAGQEIPESMSLVPVDNKDLQPQASQSANLRSPADTKKQPAPAKESEESITSGSEEASRVKPHQYAVKPVVQVDQYGVTSAPHQYAVTLPPKMPNSTPRTARKPPGTQGAPEPGILESPEPGTLGTPEPGTLKTPKPGTAGPEYSISSSDAIVSDPGVKSLLSPYSLLEVPLVGNQNGQSISHSLMRNSKFSDVTIKLKNESIPAHKAILLNRSVLFKDLLAEADQSNQLDMTKYNPVAVVAFLK
ncbi:unnamed protein product [Nesidiocoris tenuis]|uniref:BTB domain-containing protein n=1 Tax=Nesidiocoris tenuis TaxID=355587 RepID=A0A6H5FXD3_9HEMI|nr:unnamed protein product [Nesidiocoris tenuis]